MTDAGLEPRPRPAATNRQIVKAIAFGLLAVVCTVSLFAIDLANAWTWLIFFVPALLSERPSYRRFKHRYGGASTSDALGGKAPVGRVPGECSV